jgi:hypothetical protein
MMGPGEAIVAVALAGMVIGGFITIGGIVKRWFAYKDRQLGLTVDSTAEKAAQYAAHVERLEARVRVRVLERIATDKGADLAQRIEDLRDEPLRIADKELSR